MSFVGAVQFLTRIPIKRTSSAASLRSMTPWLPVVGALIGSTVGAVAAGLQYWLAPFAAAAVAVAVGMLVTGAFHEDGLADLSDAVAGGATRERRFEILKDPRLGTYGTAALCSSVLVRTAALAGMAAAGPAIAFAGPVAAHALARGISVGLLGLLPVAQVAGLGSTFREDVALGRCLATLAIAVAIATLAVGWWAAVMVGVGLLAAGALATVAVRALGGANGDVAGAVEQIAEVAALLVASALAAHHELWWR